MESHQHDTTELAVVVVKAINRFYFPQIVTEFVFILLPLVEQIMLILKIFDMDVE